jgi:hypothetical protein
LTLSSSDRSGRLCVTTGGPELIDGIVRGTTAVGQGFGVQYARWANSVLMNGLGRYEEALAAAMQASDHTPELFIETWALIELIEAATRTENPELAKRRSIRGSVGTRTG